jgi:hypothetical protein
MVLNLPPTRRAKPSPLECISTRATPSVNLGPTDLARASIECDAAAGDLSGSAGEAPTTSPVARLTGAIGRAFHLVAAIDLWAGLNRNVNSAADKRAVRSSASAIPPPALAESYRRVDRWITTSSPSAGATRPSTSIMGEAMAMRAKRSPTPPAQLPRGSRVRCT